MEINVSEIAQLLKLRKSTNHRTLLFLGTRAGGLFCNSILYEIVEKFTAHSFDDLSDSEKFRECYKVLSDQKRFTESDLYDIILGSLIRQRYREEDEYLAKLVKEDYFDIIISTNIDALLENAFRDEMREINDFAVFIAGFHSNEDIVRRWTKHCTIVKAFGDLASRNYRTVGNEFNLDEDSRLKQLLESILKRNILIVGFDPLWDQAIERAFPTSQEGSLWYVNEEPPPNDSLMAQVVKKRKGKLLSGPQGSYASFIRALYEHLIGGSLPRQRSNHDKIISSQLQPRQNTEKQQITRQAPDLSKVPPASLVSQESSPLTINSETGKRKKVFISYSHKDTRYLERLHTHLAMYERNGLVDIWDDKKIAVGADWREEIKKALEETKVAVLLVSEDFLASKYIAENELPPLLDAAKAGGAKILPVILRYCTYEDSPLERFQAVNAPSRPLATMKVHERDAIWVRVAKLVKEAFG